MRPAHERSQECLPPKKRELAQNSVSMEEQSRIESAPANDIPVSETPSWSNGVLLAAGQGVRYEVSGNGTETVTVDQYGNLYKVAVPSVTYSPTGVHSVVNMTSIPPSFSVAPSLIQHSGVTYPPIHYPISHTPVQLIGSPYTVPYAVSPGFLPLSSSATFSASQVPHYVPYNSILTEGVTPPPQDSASQSFSKVPTAQSPPVLMGVLPLDVTKGRVPVFFQHSTQLPAVYPVHEMLMTCPPNMDVRSTSNNDKDSEITITSTNMSQRPSGCASDQKSNQARSAYIHDTEGQIVRGTGEKLLECDVYSVPGQRSNTSLISHRSSPDTDLEVQSVVGGLASQDFSAAFIQKKDMQNPLKLSHDSNELLGQPRGVFVQENVVGSILERTRKPSNNFSDQHIVKYTDKTPVIANGEAMEAGIYAEQSRFSSAIEHASKTQRSRSPRHKIDTCSETAPPQAGARPTHSTSLPSHFMKGAIIQLATGELKRVEDLQTQDFVRSAEVSGGLKIDSSTVVDIQESQWPGFVTLHFVVGEQQSKVCLDVPPEHPFFVYGQGWSSCSPRQTAQLFALPCHRLQVGDVCISVSLQNISKSDVSAESCPVTTPILPQRTGKAAFLSHELSFLAAQDDEKQNQQKTDGTTTSHSQTLCSLPTVQSNSSPRVQKYSLQGTDAWPFPARHSFIPQEVKLSIEGRSNAGK
ncbi:ataxin-1-like [Bombina bombina]|uniref:ataxin-1-like n=1 Tax=Bombina bombina TaxID=8345 RepID=UPI00235ABAB4|nr:ataxin-1-like [Bombina bombina]